VTFEASRVTPQNIVKPGGLNRHAKRYFVKSCGDLTFI